MRLIDSKNWAASRRFDVALRGLEWRSVFYVLEEIAAWSSCSVLWRRRKVTVLRGERSAALDSVCSFVPSPHTLEISKALVSSSPNFHRTQIHPYAAGRWLEDGRRRRIDASIRAKLAARRGFSELVTETTTFGFHSVCGEGKIEYAEWTSNQPDTAGTCRRRRKIAASARARSALQRRSSKCEMNTTTVKRFPR